MKLIIFHNGVVKRKKIVKYSHSMGSKGAHSAQLYTGPEFLCTALEESQKRKQQKRESAKLLAQLEYAKERNKMASLSTSSKNAAGNIHSRKSNKNLSLASSSDYAPE